MLASATSIGKPALTTTWITRCAERGRLVEWLDFLVPGATICARKEEEEAMIDMFVEGGGSAGGREGIWKGLARKVRVLSFDVFFLFMRLTRVDVY